MSLHRRNPARDENESDIVEALEAVGCQVERVSSRNFPDLVVGRRGTTYLIEVKSGLGKLSKGQQEFHDTWSGGPCGVVRTVDEALKFVGVR